jgi:pimeloyl-ACP methyl ester carboxylesterase
VLTWGADDLPAVACVHTTGGHARRFERLARMLEPSRRVIAHDLRGHGRSPWSGPQTPAQHVADLDHVLDSSAVDQVTIIGHGLGARIAVEHACEYGERATALVLLDPLLLTPPTTLLLLAERERGRGGFATISDAIEAERSESGLMHTPNALLEEEMAEHLVAGEDGLYRYRYSRDAAAAALSHAAESPPDLRAVVCPTLIIRGEESELVGEDEVEQAEAELRRGRVETVPGGHAVLWDALAETSALVREFVLTATPA